MPDALLTQAVMRAFISPNILRATLATTLGGGHVAGDKGGDRGHKKARKRPNKKGGALIGGDDSIGGTPSEGVDVASSIFPSVKNQGLIEPVGF